MKLQELLAWVEARKAALGLSDAPTTIDAMRNKGDRRTPEKRELLQRAEQRGQAAGLRSVVSYY